MAWDGFTQVICKNGHYTTQSEWFEGNPCEICGAELAWENTCETTNGENPRTGQAYGFYFPAILKEAEFETCKECGNTKEISPTIYKIPTKEDMEKHRKLQEILDKKFEIDHPEAFK